MLSVLRRFAPSSATALPLASLSQGCAAFGRTGTPYAALRFLAASVAAPAAAFDRASAMPAVPPPRSVLSATAAAVARYLVSKIDIPQGAEAWARRSGCANQ